MAGYQITVDGDLMQVGFGESPASNAQFVREAEALLTQLRASGALRGGPLLRISGPASLPVMAVIVHAVAHLYGAIAIYDPKLEKFVVSITHSPGYHLGDLID